MPRLSPKHRRRQCLAQKAYSILQPCNGYNPKMRRWLLVFLMSVLSLQLSWAAVATYCQHENTPKTAHFGHHAHEHRAPRNDKGADADKKNPLAVDEDCSICHFGDTSSLPSLEPHHVPSVSPPRVALDHTLGDSHIPALPERPDRHLV